jgi:putative ABC transport system substrate-binding protein
MTGRGIISLLTALLLAGCGDGGDKAPLRIGLVPFVPINERAVEGFKAALGEAGFVEGRQVEFRAIPPDGNIEALPAKIDELLAWQPRLIFVNSTPSAVAVAKATAAGYPAVVFGPVSDPLDAGIVKDLRSPGGHITGVRLAISSGLRLEWLLRIAPQVRRIYLPYIAGDKSAVVSVQQMREAARQAGVTLLERPLQAATEIEAAAREIPAEAEAIMLAQDSRVESQVKLFVAAAQARRLPLSAPSGIQAEAGALMSFGHEHGAIGRQAGRLAVEILRGARAGDLPVETSESYLMLNLRAAEAIGLRLDDAVLRQAHRVIR